MIYLNYIERQLLSEKFCTISFQLSREQKWDIFACRNGVRFEKKKSR